MELRKCYPNKRDGELTHIRSALVSNLHLHLPVKHFRLTLLKEMEEARVRQWHQMLHLRQLALEMQPT